MRKLICGGTQQYKGLERNEPGDEQISKEEISRHYEKLKAFAEEQQVCSVFLAYRFYYLLHVFSLRDQAIYMFYVSGCVHFDNWVPEPCHKVQGTRGIYHIRTFRVFTSYVSYAKVSRHNVLNHQSSNYIYIALK